MAYLFYIFLLAFSSLAADAYKLTLHVQSPGFFCVFNTVLGALDAYDRGDIQGLVVDFEDKGLYYDSTQGPNWWNYYFKPIALGWKEGEPLKLFPQYKKTIFALRGEFEIPLERAHYLIEKYVAIKPEILSKVDGIYREKFQGSYVLGIHYRGTDKRTEAPKVAFEEVWWKADDLLQEKSGYKIFVATDDAKFFDFMKEKYPNAVFGLDAIRSTNGKPVHFAEKKENYRKGEEAVIDMLLLSKCQFLLKTASNLSHCSREFNPSIPTHQLNACFYSE